MRLLLAAAAAVAAAQMAAAATPVPAPVPVPVPAPSAISSGTEIAVPDVVPRPEPLTPPIATPMPEPLLADGTPVRLMVLKEIDGRTAQTGERFRLRVDEPIFVNGKAVVPVGATAWGEITLVKQNGAVGKGGQLAARLLYLELGESRIPLRGGYANRGAGNGAGVVLAIVGFGVLGLLNGGNSGRIKAGDTFTGYVDQAQGTTAGDPAPSG